MVLCLVAYILAKVWFLDDKHQPSFLSFYDDFRRRFLA